jgi:hypothetical protein
VNLVVSLLSSVPLATLRLIVLHDRLHAIFLLLCMRSFTDICTCVHICLFLKPLKEFFLTIMYQIIMPLLHALVQGNGDRRDQAWSLPINFSFRCVGITDQLLSLL